MIIGDLSIRGRGPSTRESQLIAQTRRSTMRQLRAAGLIDADARMPQSLVDDSGQSDAFTWALERTRRYGQPVTQRQDLDKLQMQFFDLWHIEPLVRHGIDFLVTLMFGGGGPVVEWTEEDGPGAKAWKKFDADNAYSDRLVMQGIHDTLLYGEGGMIHPDRKRESDPSTRAVWLDPAARDGFWGPKTGDSIEKVEGYRRKGGVDELPPWMVTHYRTFTTGNQPRGRPVLEPVFSDIWFLRQVMNSGMLLQEYLQRVLAFIYRLEDSERGEQVEASLKAGEISVDAPRPLEPYVVPAGANLEFPELGERLYAGDKYSRGSEYLPLLRVAWSLGIPIHLLRLEFNEANYASLLSADGPTVAKASRLIKYARPSVIDDVLKVTPGEAPGDDFKVKWPPLIMRDEYKYIEQMNAARRDGMISGETYWGEIGVDPETEQDRMDNERTAALAAEAARRDAMRDGSTVPVGDGGGDGQA